MRSRASIITCSPLLQILYVDLLVFRRQAPISLAAERFICGGFLIRGKTGYMCESVLRRNVATSTTLLTCQDDADDRCKDQMSDDPNAHCPFYILYTTSIAYEHLTSGRRCGVYYENQSLSQTKGLSQLCLSDNPSETCLISSYNPPVIFPEDCFIGSSGRSKHAYQVIFS